MSCHGPCADGTKTAPFKGAEGGPAARALISLTCGGMPMLVVGSACPLAGEHIFDGNFLVHIKHYVRTVALAPSWRMMDSAASASCEKVQLFPFSF